MIIPQNSQLYNYLNELPYPLEIKGENFFEDKLFPQSIVPLAIEIIRNLYINYLTPPDTALMMKLNTSWHHLIGTDIEIYEKKIYISACIAHARQSARKIDIGCRKEELLFKIKVFEEKYQLIQSKHPLPKIESWESLIRDVKILALVDLCQAKEKTQSIEDLLVRTKAYLEIAKVDPNHDLLEAKQSALSIKNLEKQSEAIFEIVSFEVQHNLSEAIVLADLISHPYYKSLAFVEIAKYDPMHDLSQAKQLAFDLELSLDRVMAFLQILRVEAVYDLTKATLTLQSCIPISSKLEGCKVIIEVLAQQNIEKAKEWVRYTIKPESGRLNLCYFEIVKIEVHINLMRSKITTGCISDNECKSRAYLEIAKVDPLHDLSQSKLFAKKIKNDFARSRVFHDISILQAGSDPIRALKTTIKIDFSLRDQTFKQIAKVVVVSQGNLDLAKKIALNIKDCQQQTEALLIIAGIVLDKKYE